MEIDQLAVDFLILADRAEVVNGKLYMMGGGWDRLFLQDFGQPVNFSIVLGMLVPWNRANEQHVVQLQIRDADGQPIAPSANLEFVAGRPPIMRAGETQRVMMAVNGAFALPQPGAYEVVASVDGREARRTLFYVAAGQPRPGG